MSVIRGTGGTSWRVKLQCRRDLRASFRRCRRFAEPATRPESISSDLFNRRAKEKKMKEHVSWVNELAVKDGALETFRELMEEMVSGARNEPGTLAYEWYISHDGGTVHVVETYADSAAGGAHPLSAGIDLRHCDGRFIESCPATRAVLSRQPKLDR